MSKSSLARLIARAGTAGEGGSPSETTSQTSPRASPPETADEVSQPATLATTEGQATPPATATDPPPVGPAANPIPGPMLKPIAKPAAMTTQLPGLTPGQRAAWTKAARKAGIIPAKGEAAPKGKPSATPQAQEQPRPEGMELVMTLQDVTKPTSGAAIAVSFAFIMGGNRVVTLGEIPSHERTLPLMQCRGVLLGTELVGHAEMTIRTSYASAAQLRGLLPILERMDRVLAYAHQDSEDPSFAQTVATLAASLKVTRIVMKSIDGKVVTEGKRGAAYMIAFKAEEAVIAATPKALNGKVA